MKKMLTMAVMACFMTLMAAGIAMAARPTVTDTIVNTVTADYQDALGAAMPQESDSVTVTVDQVYDVLVTAAPAGQTGSNSSCVVYTITVRNLGNGPDEFDMTYANTAGWVPDSESAYFTDAACTVALAGNQTNTLSADDGSGTTGGTQTIYAKICIPVIGSAATGSTSDETFTGTSNRDGGVANDSDTVTTTVGKADLSGSSKAADKASYVAGETVDYTITLTNSGTVTATNVVVTDVIPAQLTYVSNDAGGSYAAGTLTINVADIAAAGSTVIHVLCTVNSGYTDQTNIHNVASIAYKSNGNPAPEGPDTPFDDSLIDAPHLVVTKTSDVANAKPGDTITYTVTVTNDGADTATAVVISDTLSSWVTFGSILGGADAPVNCAPSEAGGVVSGNPNNPAAGQLGVGVTMTFKYSVVVNTN